jgi:hypothetical protein
VGQQFSLVRGGRVLGVINLFPIVGLAWLYAHHQPLGLPYAWCVAIFVSIFVATVKPKVVATVDYWSCVSALGFFLSASDTFLGLMDRGAVLNAMLLLLTAVFLTSTVVFTLVMVFNHRDDEVVDIELPEAGPFSVTRD